MKYSMVFLIIILGFACHKSGNDFSGNGRLRGRLSYLNKFDGQTIPRALAGKIVKLAYSPSDTLNYLYTTTTDSAGYFSFIRVDQGRNYDIFFQDSINGNPYAVLVTRRPTNDTITLLATNDQAVQNGLYVQVLDNNRQKLGPLSACVFNNQTLAQADTCNGSIFRINVDENGRGVKYGLAAGIYYLRARMKVGNIVFSGAVNTEVAVTGIKTVELVLSREPLVLPINGFEIRLVDIDNNPIKQASVCVFNSRALYQLDSCDGKIESLVSDSVGKIYLSNIPAGKYYLKAYSTFGINRFSGTDSIQVTPTGISTGSLKVSPATPEPPVNGVDLRVVDIFNNPVHQTNVCVFNSRALYQLDSCSGSIQTLSTNTNGRTQLYNITPGKYYFKAYSVFGNISLSGTDSVEIHASGVSSRSIVVMK